MADTAETIFLRKMGGGNGLVWRISLCTCEDGREEAMPNSFTRTVEEAAPITFQINSQKIIRVTFQSPCPSLLIKNGFAIWAGEE